MLLKMRLQNQGGDRSSVRVHFFAGQPKLLVVMRPEDDPDHLFYLDLPAFEPGEVREISLDSTKLPPEQAKALAEVDDRATPDAEGRYRLWAQSPPGQRERFWLSQFEWCGQNLLKAAGWL